jgi:uncharacterized peroxidase-related enzyme
VGAEGAAAALAGAVMDDYRTAGLAAADVALLDFAVKLTRQPAAMTVADVDALRRAGFDDAAIHEVAQITGLFNYYNRLADGLGIDPEPDWGPGGGDRGG